MKAPLVNTVQEQINGVRHKITSPLLRSVRMAVVCNDGNTVSIQASNHHYCAPRVSGLNFSEYSSFELYVTDSLLDEYCDGSVCAHVPLDIVIKYIANHGGIQGFKDFDLDSVIPLLVTITDAIQGIRDAIQRLEEIGIRCWNGNNTPAITGCIFVADENNPFVEFTTD